MNSSNIWKKRSNNKNRKERNGIVNHRHFKSKKKKKFLSKLSKETFIANWIENEGDDEQSELSIDFTSFHNNCQMKTTNEDEDSLNITNLQSLGTMKNLIFLDLDNFSSFFQYLTNPLPDRTYVMAFQGSNIQWKPPKNHFIYQNLFNLNHFQLMRPSGNRHDAADFALVLTFGKLHGLLQKSIPFTIVSGDKGFLEIIHQLKTSDRRINWFNPHQSSFENFNQLLNLTLTTL